MTPDNHPWTDDLCVCGEPDRVAPEGYTARHRQTGPCYVQEHDERFNAVWEAIKKWDISRDPQWSGYAGATGDDVCTILEAIDSIGQQQTRPTKQEAIAAAQTVAAAAYEAAAAAYADAYADAYAYVAYEAEMARIEREYPND